MPCFLNRSPFPESEQLVDLSETFKPNGFGSVSVPTLEDWKNQNTVFAGISAYLFTSFNLEGGDTPQRIPGINVEANYFDVLGVKPTLGRAFLPGEDVAGREHVVVIRNSGASRSDPRAAPPIVLRTFFEPEHISHRVARSRPVSRVHVARGNKRGMRLKIQPVAIQSL